MSIHLDLRADQNFPDPDAAYQMVHQGKNLSSPVSYISRALSLPLGAHKTKRYLHPIATTFNLAFRNRLPIKSKGSIMDRQL